jgi:hypothetical protein
MEGLGTPPARTEADLRAALAEQARRAPSADDVLSALRQAGSRRRHQSAWAAPAAAAAAMVLVIGLAVAVSHQLFGARQPALPAAPLPFYITTDLSGTRVVVRSTATGNVVAVVPVKPVVNAQWNAVAPALATGGNGTFYVAAVERGSKESTVQGSSQEVQQVEEHIYRFRLTAAGHVTGFGRVPGGTLHPGWAVDSLAASADGSRLAVGAYWSPWHTSTTGQQSDQVVVINTRTGAQRIWRGGSLAGGYNVFRVASLSWAGGVRELAVLGQWCGGINPGPGGEGCPPGDRLAQLRVINPAGPGGKVLDGRLLLRQAPGTYLAQALVSSDGSVITAMVLRGKIFGNSPISVTFPANLSVEQVSAATGQRLGVIYRRYLGDTSSESSPMNDPLTLITDATGRHLILNGGICNLHCSNEFNGWLHGGRLVPLLPAGFAHREAAEAW